jgi:hypothetical protein
VIEKKWSGGMNKQVEFTGDIILDDWRVNARLVEQAVI